MGKIIKFPRHRIRNYKYPEELTQWEINNKREKQLLITLVLLTITTGLLFTLAVLQTS